MYALIIFNSKRADAPEQSNMCCNICSSVVDICFSIYSMDMNTPIFAISRSVGWAAHIIEEKFAEAAPKPALYRPKAVYVGKDCGPQGCEYKALDLRAD